MRFVRFWSIAFSVLLITSIGYTQNTWIKSFGGDRVDEGFDIKQTSDGDHIIVGSTSSFGKGLSDVHFIKIDSTGDALLRT